MNFTNRIEKSGRLSIQEVHIDQPMANRNLPFSRAENYKINTISKITIIIYISCYFLILNSIAKTSKITNAKKQIE